jgi:hypothetical protein
METPLSPTEALRQDFVAELTEEALQTTSRYGVRGLSISRELELWSALNARTASDALAPSRRTELVADLTDTAYRVTLERGIRGSFLDLQLELWQTVCRTLRYGRFGASYWKSWRAADEPLDRGCASNPQGNR